MTYDETMALLYLAKKLYPRDKSLDKNAKEMAEIGDVWAEMLKDIPFELGKAAVAAHAAGSPYAPAISEIRAYARKMTEPAQLSADEAWERQQKRKEEQANMAPFLPPALKEKVLAIGDEN